MTTFSWAGPRTKDPAGAPRVKAAYKKARAVMEQRDERETLDLGEIETDMTLPGPLISFEMGLMQQKYYTSGRPMMLRLLHATAKRASGGESSSIVILPASSPHGCGLELNQQRSNQQGRSGPLAQWY